MVVSALVGALSFDAVGEWLPSPSYARSGIERIIRIRPARRAIGQASLQTTNSLTPSAIVGWIEEVTARWESGPHKVEIQEELDAWFDGLEPGRR
jgi:hypothetical protein